MKAHYKKHLLNFKRPSGTSRGVLTQKETWYIIIEKEGKIGVGECGILRGLSYDDRSDYENKLQWVCENISLGKEKLWEELKEFPSIQFGVEMAFLSLGSENMFELFPSDFTRKEAKIPINGLIWMGDIPYMKQQIKEKIEAGFTCVKMKIGAINFDQELAVIGAIREQYSADEIEIRVDANESFDYTIALDRLIQLSEKQIHSIEQPSKKNNTDSMSRLCKLSPLDIALDEELIGVVNYQDKENLLRKIAPKYIILKPSLIGGFRGAEEWIEIAEKLAIGWWITSALESNIGLNAIAQWTFSLNTKMPQGLGTGSLYTNNIESPLTVGKGFLYYDLKKSWDFRLV
ncbi:MAG: o-succinylbenzoate synthase [Flavobacteriales bacterium]|nr:o-succinylbenzoate synthase [Flavobacteriales bacterium]